MPLHILVLDDEEEVREALADVLTSDGHIVSLAENGFKALDMAAEDHTIDLVFSDYQMPKMNGLQFLRAFRDLSTRPVVLTSASIGLTEKEVLQNGGAALLQKPYSLSELTSVLTRLTGDLL